uniref:AIG1-type G domain-containing protein n=1 Tax=Nothobranchius rachovii TaxID=451742 RepID=A0A1A8RXT4_9TELE
MEGRVPAELEEMFGKEVLDHTLVLLTCGDYLMGRTGEEYLQTEHPGLRQMIECCGGRYHIFNNRQQENREQVHALLQKVDKMVQKNGPYSLRSPQEKDLDKRVKERKRELMESYQAQKEEKRKTVSSQSTSNTDHLYKEDKSMGLLERRERWWKEPDEIEGRLEEIKSNGLHAPSVPEQKTQSEPQDEWQFTRTPSFRLNADGALLAQMSEEKSTPKMLRLVLLGRAGSGKSAAGNQILGQEVFESHSDSFTAITQKCEKKKAVVEGKKVAVVDTPDWFNSEQTPDEVQAQVFSCVALSSPGPHAFLLCVPVDQSAKTELQAVSALEKVFGPESVQRHTLVLFTYADRLKASGKAENVEEYIASERSDLLKLVEKCGDKFHILEKGEGWREKKTVAELLEKVDQMVKAAGGQCYSCPAFQEAEDKVRQRQLQLVRERRSNRPETIQAGYGGQFHSERQLLPLVEEDMREDEIDGVRDEAEMSVSKMSIESLPPVRSSSLSPSLLRSVMEKMELTAKTLPQLLADGSVWVGEGAKTMKNSPIWGTVGTGAQNVQKLVVDSSVWGKVGATMDQVSKAVGDRVPQVVVDGSSWVGSGATAVASSPVWEIVSSGAKTGAKLVADGSVMVRSGIGAGAKRMAQSPVWGKMGSGAKTGAKMVTDSSVWEKICTSAEQAPKVVIGAAILGLLLGVVLAGVIGGVVGTAAGSAVAEVGRRKFSKRNIPEEATNVETAVESRMDALVKGAKSFKSD